MCSQHKKQPSGAVRGGETIPDSLRGEVAKWGRGAHDRSTGGRQCGGQGSHGQNQKPKEEQQLAKGIPGDKPKVNPRVSGKTLRNPEPGSHV